jgi:iron complex transport system substrate-binding protein
MNSPHWIGSRLLLSFILACFSASLAASPARDQELTVTDSLGRMVSIPRRAGRILSLQPEITRIIVALGAGQRLVGLDYFLRRDDHLFKIVFPRESGLPVVSKPDDSINKELVVRLDPDVIFASPSEFQVPDSIQRTLGIPVVALSSLGRFDKLLEEMQLVGAITGFEGRARELMAYFRERIQPVSDFVSSLGPESRPKVYLSFWSSFTRTPVFYEPVNVAGGVNLAEKLLPSHLGTVQTVVTLEHIIKWDPDLILVQGNYPPEKRTVTVDQVLKDRRLSSLKAVRDRRVRYTFGFWYWWDPAEVLVETLYLASLFHPERFGRFDMNREGEEIFKKFYPVDGAFAELAKVLDLDEWTHK